MNLKFLILIISFWACSSTKPQKKSEESVLKTGAEQTELYLKQLKNKKVGLVVNHTATIGKTHLVDSLLKLNVNIQTIFGPEHGFRGTAGAGDKVSSEIDAKTGIQIVSLYGKNNKPTAENLKNLDVVIFDIQDVGARFYTYISTMHLVIEACAENNKPLIILDRPNPNGHYVDGPILEKEFTSFVGMHPIPVVHGLTIGELAKMINGEKWLKNGIQCNLTVIPCANYTHETAYVLPIAPSPNLPNQQAIKLYPSLCFFEGTNVSVGRGTNKQFQLVGSPNYKKASYEFTPVSKPEASNPLNKDLLCKGHDLSSQNLDIKALDLNYLIDFYQNSDKKTFFTSPSFFDKLAGTKSLREQIIAEKSAEEIRSTWQNGLETYKKMRGKYLIYP